MPAQDDRRHERLELARQWRDSGASARAFATEHGVTAWTLYYWRQRLASQDQPRRRSRGVKLAPVHVVTVAKDEASDVEILLAGGDRVRVAAGVSVETLRRVVQALRTAC
jgi:transposase-like protein